MKQNVSLNQVEKFISKSMSINSNLISRDRTQVSQPIKPNLGSNSGYTKTILGPHRVFPGRLSVNFILKTIQTNILSQVSRTFGDVEAKLPKYGGIPGVVSAEPEIKTFKLVKEDDFIVLACKEFRELLCN